MRHHPWRSPCRLHLPHEHAPKGRLASVLWSVRLPGHPAGAPNGHVGTVVALTRENAETTAMRLHGSGVIVQRETCLWSRR